MKRLVTLPKSEPPWLRRLIHTMDGTRPPKRFFKRRVLKKQAELRFLRS
jgi:hypothetical protein